MMGLEVEFITLGDAAARLDTPPPTLRLWTDQLEEYEVHFTMRNNRNERIYYDSDLEIFKFIRDWKEEYGRRTTTKDLAQMLMERGRKGEYELRTKEDAPSASIPSNKTNDLLNQEDIKRLMQSDRVKQFIEIIISETQGSLKGELVGEFSKQLHLKTQDALEEMREIEKRSIEREKKEQGRLERMESMLNEIKQYTQPVVEEEVIEENPVKEEKVGWLKKLLGN